MLLHGVFFAEKDENNKPIGMFNSKINELVTEKVNSYKESFSRVTSEETTEEIPLNYSMATYAPICHLPQAVGMFLTRIFGGGISVQCYVARLFNMVAASLLMFLAIRIIPFKKSIVCFLGLLPITISEFASMSSDVLASTMFLVNDDKEREKFPLKTKILYTFIFSCIVILIYTSLYVAWTHLKSPLILGVQARYFLPVVLLTAIIFDNKKIIFNDRFKNKYMMSFMLFMNLNVLSSLTFTYIFNYIIEYYIK